MKKAIMILIVLIPLFGSKTQAQENWKFLFSKNGLDVYGRWTCQSCYDRHYSVKITNNNPYKVNWSYKRFEWTDSYGNVVKSESGASWSISGYSTQSPAASGLWFYPPEGTKGNGLQIAFVNFTVTRD